MLGHQSPAPVRVSLAEIALVALAAGMLTAVMTYPLAVHPGSIGRANIDDGRFSIWNVAWVARTLVVDPRHVYDANIFYPHRSTLAYSENNLGAGVLAIPAYWVSRNPYLAHNFVVLLAFVLTLCGMYFLVRYLARDRLAAFAAAVGFAFCPHVLAHTAHIQLLLTAGLPFSMLAFHRLADRPAPGRGVVLGAVMAAQAVCCGYYGVFAALIVGFAVLVIASTRRLWAHPPYWIAVGTAAAVAIAIVLPLFLPYLRLQRRSGFGRTLVDAAQWSSDWRAYLASAAFAHAWMLPALGRWNEVLFPGFIVSVCGVAGMFVAWRRARELAILYGGLAVLAAWASFGPPAGLYTVLFHLVPVFSMLRAPARFGLMVTFGLSALAGVALAALLGRVRHRTLIGWAMAIAVAGELAVRIDLRPVPPLAPVYRTLAMLPDGPVIEMPFFERRIFYPRHTIYMLASTAHWKPLVNGYSDFIPRDFLHRAVVLAPFPFPGAFKLLQRSRVRYAVFHLDMYDARTRREVESRLNEFSAYLRPVYADADTRLYEIVGSPP